MRRILSLFLPDWPTDRLRRGILSAGPAEHAPARLSSWRPFVTAISIGSRRLVAAVDPVAADAGIRPGMPLADAQAYVPALVVFPADPAGDHAELHRFAEWCGRYSPWVAPDGADGLLLDITGCAHLRGGENSLGTQILETFARLGITARAAIADTAAAAWALARFGKGDGDRVALTIVPPGGAMPMLAPLPVAALRLDVGSLAGLEKLGLRRIADLARMPRAALAQRFGSTIARRLDEARGLAEAPLSPLQATPARRARLAFAEPIATPEDLARAVALLLAELCRGLAAEGVGARRLQLACYRVDGRVENAAIGTARPNRDAAHLGRLLAEKLTRIDPGLGIEEMVLIAPVAERLAAAQTAFPAAGKNLTAAPRDLAPLIDRLGNRLGLANLQRFQPVASHLPERAVALAPPLSAEAGAPPIAWPSFWVRPIRLFTPPQPIEATAPIPDDPPVLFRWRRLLHRVRRADGPERIAEEWWRPSQSSGSAGSVDPSDPQAIRDYYRVEDETGRRFWLFRAGLFQPDRPARWFIHGLFA